MFKKSFLLIILIIFLAYCQSQDVKLGREEKLVDTKIELTEKTGSVPETMAEEKEVEQVYVAIMDFQILSSDKEISALAQDIPQSLIQSFLKSRYLKPVERQELMKAVAELELSQSDLADEAYAQKVGKLLGAKYLLLGSLTKIGDNIKINSRLIKTETGEIVNTNSVKGTIDTIFDLEEELAQTIEQNIKSPQQIELEKGERVYVAIMDFQILSSDKEVSVLSQDIPQSLIQSFLKSRYIKPVERQELMKAVAELELSQSDLADEAYALRVGKLLGAKYLLLGSLTKIADNVKISCRLIRTETGEIVNTSSARGTINAVFDLEEELAQKIEENIKHL